MHHLISHIGLKFYLFKIQGTLSYEYTKSGRPAKQYDISDTDIEDASSSESSDTEALLPMRPGVDASAVGIQLRLAKNDGHVRMKFEGRDGSTAEWAFDGLETMNSGKMTASTGTQTSIDTHECVLCGSNQVTKSAVRNYAAQTEVVVVRGITFSVEAATQTANEARTVVKSEDTEQPPQVAMQGASSQTSPIASITTELKRKPSSPPPPDVPLHKRAKSKHDTEPWPRVIYMTCQRTHPARKGDVGKLIINTAQGTLWYEDSHGKPHALTIETKQVYLKNASTKVTYCPSARGNTHELLIERLTRAGDFTKVSAFLCGAPTWKMWYLSAMDGGTKMYVTDPEAVVDAIVHCIDRTSGREAVRDLSADKMGS